MESIITINTIGELNKLLNQDKSKHPLVSVIDFSKVVYSWEDNVKLTSTFYSIMLKNNCFGKFKYGREYYDFEEGSLLCIGPNQVVTIENDGASTEGLDGWGLFFHPDLIRGTSLGSKIKDYTFFSYDRNEALHLSDMEKQTLQDCISKIELELSQSIDKHTQTLLVSTIELFLNYCTRYYDRQFITRIVSNKAIFSKFEFVLHDYFTTKKHKLQGLPTVKYLAENLSLSANYLSDVLKKETGKNAQDHIHSFIIDEAKTSLLNSNVTVSEIAYELGFEYPQYFSKLFKTKTGMTPAEYRTIR